MKKYQPPFCSIRVKAEARKLSEQIRKKANLKDWGKYISDADVALFAFSKINNAEDIKSLQLTSIKSAADTKKILFEFFLNDENPKATWDDFEKFQMTSKWISFLKKHNYLM